MRLKTCRHCRAHLIQLTTITPVESHELEHLGTYLRHQHQLAQHRRFFLAVDDQTFGAVEVEAEAALKRESSEALIIERGPEGQTIPSAHSSSTSSLAILNTFESEGVSAQNKCVRLFEGSSSFARGVHRSRSRHSL